jgi:hypothetical protein
VPRNEAMVRFRPLGRGMDGVQVRNRRQPPTERQLDQRSPSDSTLQR